MDDVDIQELLEHRIWLAGLIHHLLGTRAPTDADDVLQETWVRAFSRPPARRGSVRGWLGRVAGNVIRDRWRRERSRARREEAAARPEAVEPPDAAVRAERVRLVITAVLELDEPYRSTILARFFDALPAAEIARREGVPAATVRSRVARGLALLRARLEREFGDGRYGLAAALTSLIDSRPRGSAMASALTGGGVMTTKILLAAAVVVLAVSVALTGVIGDQGVAPPAPIPALPPPSEPSSPLADAATSPAPAEDPAPGRPAPEELSNLEIEKRIEESVVTIRADAEPLHMFVTRLGEEVGVRFRIAACVVDLRETPITVNFEATGARDILDFIAALKGVSWSVTSYGVEIGPVVPETPVRTIAAYRRAREIHKARSRSVWSVPDPWTFAEEEVRLSPFVSIESLLDLAVELKRVLPRLPVTIGAEFRRLELKNVPRSGSALSILTAALGGHDGLRAVATVRGLDVLPAAAASNAGKELEACLKVIAALERKTVADAANLGSLVRDFGRKSGVPTFLDPDIAGLQIRSPSEASVREALVALETQLVLWVVTDGTLVVIEADPPHRPALPAEHTPEEPPSFRGHGWRDWGRALGIHPNALSRVEWAACNLLAAGGADALPVIEKLIEHEEPDVRRFALAAATATGRGCVPLLPAIEQRLDDPVDEVRASAARLLGLRHPEARETLDALTRALEDPSGWVRAEAAGALWRLTGKSERIGPVLGAALEEGGVAGITASAVLIQMGGESAAILSDALGSGSARGRAAAYRTIRYLGPRVRTLSDRLRELLGDPDYEDADRARAALKLLE